ncbi:MAG: hypothetical protein NZ750_14125 [Anaerolineae bacterium]|nr:hypothetical protein [Anaerolineae bacterium]MDW8173739.1 hypothetical protein [Anaerolineae bacterium]
MIVRRLSAVLLTLLIGAPALAQSNSFCQEQGIVCQQIGLDVRLRQVKAISVQPIFATPMLEADLDGVRPNTRLVLPDWDDTIYLLSSPEGVEVCELMIAGFADPSPPYAFTPYLDLTTNTSRVKIYAYCQTANFPSLRAPGPRPPSQGDGELSRELRELPRGQRERVAQVWQRASSGACVDSKNEIIGMASILTQTAVFMAADENLTPESFIRRYHEEAQIPLAKSDYHALYCLLGQEEAPLAADLALSFDPPTGFAPARLRLEDRSQGMPFDRRLTISHEGLTIYSGDALPTDGLLLTEAGDYEVTWTLEGSAFTYEVQPDGSRRSVARQPQSFTETFSLSSLNPSPTPIPDLDRPVLIGSVSLGLPTWTLLISSYLIFAVVGWAFMSRPLTRLIWFLANALLIVLVVLLRDRLP